MLQRVKASPRRILMTVDAVGGVWQYALCLAEQLAASGNVLVLAGLGPQPSPEQRRQAQALATLEWLRTPPDWMAGRPEDVAGLHDELSPLVSKYAIDLVQVNEPGQAADLFLDCPVVAVAHSCTATWFRAVREAPAPGDWRWCENRTRKGMRRADLVVAPSASHASALVECYGALPRLIVVQNGVSSSADATERDNIVFAAGRWWDDGKNGSVLDRAASETNWPVLAAGATMGPNGQGMTFRNAISLGLISNTETRELAARCGVFVSPSIYEPFGLAALEAAVAGTPLVLAEIPTYRELWSDAALFFPARDSAVLAAQINRLAADDQLRRELGAAALDRARCYTPQRQAATMQQVYDAAAAYHVGEA